MVGGRTVTKLNYTGCNDEQSAYLQAAANNPIQYGKDKAGSTHPLQVMQYESTAALWAHCPDVLARHDGSTYDTMVRYVLSDWDGDANRARQMLAAGAATEQQKKRLEAALERVDAGTVAGACESFSRRAKYAHFEDADEPCIDRVIAGHDVWTAGVKRGRMAPTVKLGFNTLIGMKYRTLDAYTVVAAIGYLAAQAAAQLGWGVEIWYLNTGLEYLGGCSTGQLGIACKLAGADRPLDPEVFAAHSGSAGHVWAAWVNNCAQCGPYRQAGATFTSSRGAYNGPSAEAVANAIGLDYLLSTNIPGQSLEQMTAGILGAGMDAALAKMGTPRTPEEIIADVEAAEARFAARATL